MNKKILIYGIIGILLMSSFAFGYELPDKASTINKVINVSSDKVDLPEVQVEREEVEIEHGDKLSNMVGQNVTEDKEEKTVVYKIINTQNLTGLNNAILRVRKEETAKHLQEILAKIDTKRIQIIQKIEQLKMTENVNGDIEADGKKDAKLFGFIKMKKDVKYIVNPNTGDITKVKRWYDFVLVEEKDE